MTFDLTWDSMTVLIVQYIFHCHDLLPVFIKSNLIESKQYKISFDCDF